MERIDAYTTRIEGGIHVDIEGMTIDLVTVIKADGKSKKEFIDFVSEIFDDVEVVVRARD